jgi:dUTPase
MVLTAAQITSNNIVQNAGGGYRATTYDATVGGIFQAGVEISTGAFVLPPRGVVWVVSKEEFNLPETITGLATLKTSWTHRGVLALNVGIVDPGYRGALATALVNFSESDFEVKVGEPFFRVLFFKHANTGAAPSGEPLPEYRRRVLDYSRSYRKSFLNMEAVASQVAERVFGLPKWSTYLGLFALLIALVAIFVPIAFSVYSDYRLVPAKVEALQKQIDDLKAADSDGARLLAAEQRIDELTKAKPQERIVIRNRPTPPPSQRTTVVVQR